MKFKYWSKEDLLENDILDGTTEYNKIESYIKTDHVNPHDLQRSLYNVYGNQENIYKYLDSISKLCVNKGVIKTPLTKEFELVYSSVLIDGVITDFSYLKSGNAFINDYTVMNFSNISSTNRQIEKILNLDSTLNEEVNITYDIVSDKLSCVISVLNSTTLLIEEKNYLNYDNSITLLQAIYNDYPTEFSVLNRDLSKLSLEPTMYLLNTTDTFYYKINTTGDIIVNNTPPTVDEITLQNIIYNVNHTATISSYTVIDYSIKNYNELKDNLFFNISDHPDFDSKNINDVLDYTTSIDNISGEDSFLVFLREGGSAGTESGVFGFTNSEIQNIDKYGSTISDNQVFYMNKDFVVRYGTNVQDIIKFSNLVANATSSTPTVDRYDELSSTPSNGTDGAVVFVRNLNELYRYSSSSQTWVNLSDRHKQFSGITSIKLATDFETGYTDYTVYKFDTVTFKTSGANIDVFVNGLHMDKGSAPLGDYIILNDTTIIFNSPLDNDPSNTIITLKVIVGGENFYPEKRTYIIGHALDDYTGSLTDIKTNFHIMPNRTDVFLSGSILAESVIDKNYGNDGMITVTSVTNPSTFTANTEDFTGTENYFIQFISTDNNLNVYEVRRIDSVSTDTITLDTPLPASLSINDTFLIAEDIDYFINEYKDIVTLSDPASTDEIIQIRDRAGLVSTYETIAGGSSLPTEGIFGQEYYVDPYWYKWNGFEWQQMNGNSGGGATNSVTEFVCAEAINKADIVCLNIDGKIVKADVSTNKFFVVGSALTDGVIDEIISVQKSGLNNNYYNLQYNTGIVTTDGTSNIVTGTGTSFVSNVVIGDYFNFQGNPNFHKIISVDSNTQLTLETIPVLASGATYEINRGILNIGQQYFGGINGGLLSTGEIEYYYTKVPIGYSKSSYQLDLNISSPEPNRSYDNGLDVGARIQYATYKDRSNQGMLPDDFDNAISQANYSILFAEIGHKWNDAHVAAGDTDVTILDTLFYPTPPPGFYSRSGIPNSASIDATADISTGNDTITLSEADYNKYRRMKYFTDSYNGVPVYLIGTLPTGLSIGTVYYLRFVDDVNFYVKAYLTEQNAIDDSSAVDITATATGTFNLTQEGIVLDDAMQGHIHEVDTHVQITGAGADGSVRRGMDDPITLDSEEPKEDTLNNGTPRTINETRPKTVIMFYYTKVEYITTAGEPISAIQYIQDWSSTSTWTAGASITITHDWGVPFDEYTGQIFVRATATPDKIYNVTDYDIYDGSTTHYGQRLNGVSGNNNICVLQMHNASNPGRYIPDTGGSAIILTDGSFEYKVVLTKINLVATYAETSYRKVFNITTGDNQTFTLPDASTQITEYNIKRTGAGAGTVTITTSGSDTIEGSSSPYIMRGDETLRIIPNGINWAIVSTNEKRVCKAWVNFDGTTNTAGDCDIRDSFNVSSVTDNGTGDYTVNFINAMKDANYSAVVTASCLNWVNSGNQATAFNTGHVRVSHIESATGADSNRISVQIFGS